MARSVHDVALVLDVLAGYDPEDPVTARSSGKIPSTYLDCLTQTSLRGKRLGLLRYFQGIEEKHEEVNHAMANMSDVMRLAGANVIVVDDPYLEADALIRQYDVQKWEFKSLLNRYLGMEPNAPVHTLGDIIETGLFHKESLQDFFSQAEGITDREHDVEYLGRLAGLENLRDRLFKHMADQHLDALIYPLQKRMVVPIVCSGQVERNGILAGLTGFPALNVPDGFSPPTQQAPLGVPIGLDIMVRPFDEPLLLGLGYAYEQLTKFRQPPICTSWPY
jgi:Asp-tRNA(Asn)/Glu-tRNA(Gln) amidotransferase A subunit family amidase